MHVEKCAKWAASIELPCALKVQFILLLEERIVVEVLKTNVER